MHDKTWSGRFNEPVSELVKQYTASIGFDRRLAEWDIQGSLAHAQMLKETGVLDEGDLADIRRGMAEILEEIRSGKIEWSSDLEDVHMNIERRLTDKIGDAGKRLHTGRSRNDQVATDIRLWLRDGYRYTKPDSKPSDGIAGFGGTKRRNRHARLYPPASRPARQLRTPYARLRRNARTR